MGKAFRNAIRSDGLKIAGLTAGCPGYPADIVAHSFSSNEMAIQSSKQYIGMIIHRGNQINIPGFNLIHTHTEFAVVFTSGVRRTVTNVSLEEIINGLTSNNSSMGSRKDYQILHHNGTLNKKALQFILSELGGSILVSEKQSSFFSYRELALAGIGTPGTLVIGLRGKDTVDPQLHPVSVNNINPLNPTARESYPLKLKVHVYLKEEQPDVHKQQVLEYLNLVHQRIIEDNMSMFNTCRYTNQLHEHLLAA